MNENKGLEKKNRRTRQRRHRRVTKEKLIITIASIMLLLSIFVGVGSVTIIRSRPIRFGMENLGELVTQAGYYTNVQSVEKARDVFGVEVPFTQSKYIFSYDGIIKAGINFQDVKVTVDEVTRTINVKVPEAMIISNELDEESLEIYDESRNIFTPLKLDDVNTSLIAIQEESEKMAIDNGLLENAKTNAQAMISAFVSSQYDMSIYSIKFK